MSQHSGPHFRVVPDDERCEAIVLGIAHCYWEWQRVDHRCPRRANQGRAGRMVCHLHAKAKEVKYQCQTFAKNN